MRKKDLVEGEWYWIDYDDPDDPECSFHGPAQLAQLATGRCSFQSPLLSSWYEDFYLEDIAGPYLPFPDFNALVYSYLPKTYPGTGRAAYYAWEEVQRRLIEHFQRGLQSVMNEQSDDRL